MVEDFMCNLKVYRVAQGLTQEQLAEKVGVRRETIMRLEKAQYNPSLKLAIDISRVLNAPIEDIFIFFLNKIVVVNSVLCDIGNNRILSFTSI